MEIHARFLVPSALEILFKLNSQLFARLLLLLVGLQWNRDVQDFACVYVMTHDCKDSLGLYVYECMYAL